MDVRKKDRGLDERLDAFGREVIRASSLNEEEAEAVASAPFLYSRVRSRIAAEASGREEKENWLSMLVVFWRAVPALALVAMVCFVLFLTANLTGTSSTDVRDDAAISTTDSGIEQAVFVERQPLSSDEVLATILNRDDAEVSK